MQFKKIILLFLFGCRFTLSAQINLDSIRSLTTSKNLNIKVEALADLALQLKFINKDSALTLAILAEKSLTPDVGLKLQSLVYHNLGSVYSAKLDYASAKPWLEKAYQLRVREKDELQQLASLINLVYAYQGLGDLKNTHKYVFVAESLCEKIAQKDSKLYIITLNQLGDIYFYLKRFDKSEEFYKKALESAERAGRDNELALVYQNYGAFLIGRDKYKEALPYIEKGLTYQKKLNQPSETEAAMVNLAIVYAETGRKQDALKIFEEIYTNRKKGNVYYEISTASNNLAFFYVTEEKYEKAIPLFLESTVAAQKAKAPRLEMARYEILSECYEAISDYKNAHKYGKLFGKMKDSLFSLETVKQLNDLTEKYGTEKKEKKILELQRNNAESKLKEEATKRESQKNILILGSVIVLFLVISIFIYLSFLQKKKANSALTLKNEQIEHQNVLLEEKQKEILDSIHYAKRIQHSLLPTEKYFERKITELKKKS